MPPLPGNLPTGAAVEIYEPYTEKLALREDQEKQDFLDGVICIKPYRVRVNGVDVGLIKRGSLSVDVSEGDEGAAEVTFTLLPKSISIHAE